MLSASRCGAIAIELPDDLHSASPEFPQLITANSASIDGQASRRADFVTGATRFLDCLIAVVAYYFRDDITMPAIMLRFSLQMRRRPRRHASRFRRRISSCRAPAVFTPRGIFEAFSWLRGILPSMYPPPVRGLCYHSLSPRYASRFMTSPGIAPGAMADADAPVKWQLILPIWPAFRLNRPFA